MKKKERQPYTAYKIFMGEKYINHIISLGWAGKRIFEILPKTELCSWFWRAYGLCSGMDPNTGTI